jgi:hypothetical protein
MLDISLGEDLRGGSRAHVICGFLQEAIRLARAAKCPDVRAMTYYEVGGLLRFVH